MISDAMFLWVSIHFIQEKYFDAKVCKVNIRSCDVLIHLVIAFVGEILECLQNFICDILEKSWKTKNT